MNKFLNSFFGSSEPTEKTKTKTAEKQTVTPAVKTTTFTPGYSPTQTDVATYQTGNATTDALDYFANLLKEKNLPGM